MEIKKVIPSLFEKYLLTLSKCFIIKIRKDKIKKNLIIKPKQKYGKSKKESGKKKSGKEAGKKKSCQKSQKKKIAQSKIRPVEQGEFFCCWIRSGQIIGDNSLISVVLTVQSRKFLESKVMSQV